MKLRLVWLPLGASTLVAGLDGVVELSFQRQSHPLELGGLTLKRADSISSALVNNLTAGGYYAPLDVGTPPQRVMVMIDTGSSDTWVIDEEADLCNNATLQSKWGGCAATYDSSGSSSRTMVSRNGFDVKYLDGRNCQGDYVTETIVFGDNGPVIKGQQIGVANHTMRPFGILGLGFRENQAASKKYPTVVDTMLAQGAIGRTAFSLFLGELSAHTGAILIGGLDTEKFFGPLEAVPLIRDLATRNFSSYTVELSSLGITDPDGTAQRLAGTNLQVPAILDSGSTITLLPRRFVIPIWERFPVQVSDYAFIDCKLGQGSNATRTFFDFQFGDVTIHVPFEAMVVDSLGPIKQMVRELVSMDDPCLFGLQNSDLFDFGAGEFAILGDTFLRSTYVVFDQQSLTVGMAHANVRATKRNILSLPSTDEGIPKVMGLPLDQANLPLRASGAASDSTTSSGDRSRHSAAGRIAGDLVTTKLGIIGLAGLVALAGGALVTA